MKRENLKIIKIVGCIAVSLTVLCGICIIVKTILSNNRKEEEDLDSLFLD